MTTTNGWPGKPGVPLNPEKDGWHWIQESDLDPECAFWRAQPWFGDKQGEWETTGTEDDFAPYEVSTWRYFGPVLLPDEATALQARADRNAAGFARVDAEAERDKFLYKQEIAALQKRVAELEAENVALRNNKTEEESLRQMMRDPRYWRHRDPEFVNKVRDGFRKLIGGKDE